MKFMEGREMWEGSAEELLQGLETVIDDRTRHAKGWPKAANAMSGKLKRSATALRASGLEVTKGRNNAGRHIRLEWKSEIIVTHRHDGLTHQNNKDKMMTMPHGNTDTPSSPDEESSPNRHTDPSEIHTSFQCNTHDGDSGDDGDDKYAPFSQENLREVTL
jgi:hypothetical protein